jgi:mRNA-degrading endonuclease RelE of RelBE toxin-antitoxin system
MNYQVKFPNHSIEKKFEKTLSIIPNLQIKGKIMEDVEKLAGNPRPYGEMPFKKLKPSIQLYRFVAQYRIRIGNYRVLYDIDDRRRIVWILALRKRSGRTYK